MKNDLFDQAVEKLEALETTHDCDGTIKRYTNGFFEEGPGFGVGIARSCCVNCVAIVEATLAPVSEWLKERAGQ